MTSFNDHNTEAEMTATEERWPLDTQWSQVIKGRDGKEQLDSGL